MSGKVGRPGKGPRKPIMVRTPVDLHADLDRAWRAAGYACLNDYVVDVLAAAHGRKVKPPAQSEQATLPLAETAAA
ncbi:hypothetical protein [Nonomuraea aridisoli]|uniref:hypothetical protein n=1 Tax=Nonomuraea aridisoli TaxID=2070368 RepID=UPI0011B9357F|nr:hypothetical protein [Nonomuraea aridisoli]